MGKKRRDVNEGSRDVCWVDSNTEEEPNDSDQTAKGDTREEGFTDRRGEVDVGNRKSN